MTAQPSLFDKREHLSRVSSRIAQACLDFASANSVFRMEAMRARVVEVVGPIAPGSVDRVWRAMRAQGRVRYTVLSRKDSMYLVNEVVKSSEPLARCELAKIRAQNTTPNGTPARCEMGTCAGSSDG